MRNTTHRDDTGSALQRLVPLIALTVTVGLGMTLGLWMVFMALTAAPTSPQAASGDGHVDAQAPAHGHSDTGVAPMPGLDRVAAPTPSTAAGTAHAPNSAGTADTAGSADEMAGMAGMEGMEGMTPVDPAVTPTTPSEPSDPMAVMSDDEMAAMGHPADAHTAAAADGQSGRPLAATMSGFGLVNLALLIGALIVGRRRGRPSGRPQGSTPSRRTAATGTGAAPDARSTESAGSPS